MRMLLIIIFSLCTGTTASSSYLYEVHFSSWSGDRVRQLTLSFINQASDVLECAAAAAKHLLSDQLLVFIGGDWSKEPQCIVANRSAGLCRRLMPTQQPPCSIRVFVTSLSNCWISIQRRVDNSTDFFRNWTEYTVGFGQGPHTNHWIGLQILHSLTWPSGRALRIRMKLWNDTEYWADYTSFSVASESDKFRLSISGFHGSQPMLGDSMSYHSGMLFSTGDSDNDPAPEYSCSSYFKACWWYKTCYVCNPNGLYYNAPAALGTFKPDGVTWNAPFGSNYSMKEFEMLLAN